ncbi:MAG: hypothetical protein WCA83_13965 [Azonexus sp.]
MRAIIVAVISVLAVVGVRADEAGSRVVGDELRALVNGANVTHVTRAGSERRWTDEADGTLVASSTNKKRGSAMGGAVTAQGKWSVSADDKYCVEIDWKREDEKWCAAIIKADGSYYLNSVDPARKIEFSR